MHATVWGHQYRCAEATWACGDDLRRVLLHTLRRSEYTWAFVTLARASVPLVFHRATLPWILTKTSTPQVARIADTLERVPRQRGLSVDFARGVATGATILPAGA